MNQSGLNRAAILILPLFLAACGGGNSSGGATGAAPASALSGTVHGGQSGLVGSTVSVYSMGSTTPLATATTGSGGAFTANFTCPKLKFGIAEIYVTVKGGFPGGDGTQSNSAISLESALGNCEDLPSFVEINELTTVATAYALNAFHTSSGFTGGSSVSLVNALATETELVDVVGGGPASTLPRASDCSASSPPINCVTLETLDTVANSLAACVNSSGASSSQCTELFDCATPGASFSNGSCSPPGGATVPGDTLQAALSLARNPGSVAVSGIYNAPTPDTVFSPTLSAAPSDWTLSLSYTVTAYDTDGVQGFPGGLAIDASGNVWITIDYNVNTTASPIAPPEFSYEGYVAKLGPTGAVLSGNGYTGGGLARPGVIAIDGNGYVWIADYGYSAADHGPDPVIVELAANGSPVSPTGYAIGPNNNSAQGLAVDQSGNIWIVEEESNELGEMYGSSSSTPGSWYPNSPYTGGGLNLPFSPAIDSNGNVWLTDQTANGTSTIISEYLPGSSAWAFGNSGLVLGSGYATEYLAIDQKDNVWVLMVAYSNGNELNTLVELNSQGQLLSGYQGYNGGGLDNPVAIAIDGAGNVWVMNQNVNGGGSISEFEGASGSNPGQALSPNGTGFKGAGLSTADATLAGMAIDGSGNLWVVCSNSDHGTSATKFIGVASPVLTPLIGPPQD